MKNQINRRNAAHHQNGGGYALFCCVQRGLGLNNFPSMLKIWPGGLKTCLLILISLWDVLGIAKVYGQSVDFETPASTRCATVPINQADPVNTVVIRTTISATKLNAPDWLLSPGLMKVDEGTGPGTFQYWVEVKSKGTDDPEPFCPGTVTFRWKGSNPECEVEYLAQNQISCQVFKRFTGKQLENWSTANLNVPFEIYTETPPCVDPDQKVNLSIRPLHFCQPPNSTATNPYNYVEDQIAWNSTHWGIPYFVSTDQTSATFNSAVADETQIVTATLGRCNIESTGDPNPYKPSATKVFNLAPEPARITTPNGFFPYKMDGTVGVPGEACLPANTGGSFTLTVLPAQLTSTDGYIWTIPQGFTCAGGCNTQTVTVTALTNSGAASGQFICRIDNGQCGRAVAFFNVIRSLGDNTISITKSRTEGEPFTPSPADGAGPSYCYYRDLHYIFTKTNAPQNNTYTWSPTAGTPHWTEVSGQGTAIFAADPPQTPTSGTPPGQPLELLVTGPPFGAGLASCTSSVSLSGYVATDHTGTGLKILKSGNSFDVVTDNTTESTQWYNSSNFTCSQTLGASNFYYEWGFIGSYTENGTTYHNPSESEIFLSHNDAAFASSPRGFGINGITKDQGTFSSGSLIYCRIRKRNTQACSEAERNCFYAFLTIEVQ